MSDVAIEFKNEIFYGEKIVASVTTAEFSKVAFEVSYKLEKQSAGESGRDKRTLVAIAKTGMVCYNYSSKKIAAIPEKVIQKLAIGHIQ